MCYLYMLMPICFALDLIQGLRRTTPPARTTPPPGTGKGVESACLAQHWRGAYITGDAEEDEGICTLPAHAARKGLIQYAALEDHERPPSP